MQDPQLTELDPTLALTLSLRKLIVTVFEQVHSADDLLREVTLLNMRGPEYLKQRNIEVPDTIEVESIKYFFPVALAFSGDSSSNYQIYSADRPPIKLPAPGPSCWDHVRYVGYFRYGNRRCDVYENNCGFQFNICYTVRQQPGGGPIA
jgi:hypothetical protein